MAAKRKQIRRSDPLLKNVQEPIVKLVQMGVEPVQAAITQGVEETTFEEWMRRGRVGGLGYAVHIAFRRAVLQAEAECEAMLVQRLRSAKDWQAALSMLERRFPERWLRRSVNGEQRDRADGRPAGGGSPFEQLDNVVEINRREKR